MDLAGKSVLVTGASRGIGAAIARAFAREKAHVTVNYRSNRTRCVGPLHPPFIRDHYGISAASSGTVVSPSKDG